MDQEIPLLFCGLVVPGLPLILPQMSRISFWFPNSGCANFFRCFFCDFFQSVYCGYGKCIFFNCFSNGLTGWHNFARLDIILIRSCTDPRKDLSFFNGVGCFCLRTGLVLLSNGFLPLFVKT